MPGFTQPQTSGNTINTAGSNEPVDSSLAQQMHGLVSEAAERVTFHRCELERWERVGRAATRAINELQATDPVAQQAPEGFLAHEQVDAPAEARGW